MCQWIPTSLQQDAEKLFFGITILLASPENKGLTGAEVGKNRPPFDFFSILLGIGREYAEALFKPFYSKSMSCTEAGYVAIYALWKVKMFVQGCGGMSHIREIPNEPGFLPQPRWLAEVDMKRIEDNFEFFEKTICPLVPVFPNRQVDRTEFQAHLTRMVKALKKRRVQVLRGRDLTMVGTWLEEYG
ncbi:MAG: hypothetical protein ABSA59_24600 [Terriglobia bacterium]